MIICVQTTFAQPPYRFHTPTTTSFSLSLSPRVGLQTTTTIPFMKQKQVEKRLRYVQRRNFCEQRFYASFYGSDPDNFREEFRDDVIAVTMATPPPRLKQIVLV